MLDITIKMKKYDIMYIILERRNNKLFLHPYSILYADTLFPSKHQIILNYNDTNIQIVAYSLKTVMTAYSQIYDSSMQIKNKVDCIIANVRTDLNTWQNVYTRGFCGYTTDKFVITSICDEYEPEINGTFVHGKPHSINDQPIISLYDQTWYLYGFKHRLNKPACISLSQIFNIQLYTKYYQYGQLHYSDGPAIDHMRKSWYFHGFELSEEEHKLTIKWYKLYQSIIEHVKFTQ